MRFEWRLTWKDKQGRPWASDLLTATDPSEARRLHRLSMNGDWVTEEMVAPMVTDLHVFQNGRAVEVAEGGAVHSLGSRLLAGR